MKIFILILTFLYSTGGIITFFGYFPTIKDLWKQEKEVNVITYIIWTITTFTTSLYGFFVIKNFMFNIIVNLQLFACIIILFLIFKNKYRKI